MRWCWSWRAATAACALAAASLSASAGGGAPKGCEPVEWQALVPPHWDAQAEVRDLGLERMEDGDPAAVEALRVLRARWDEAPANPAMAHARICLAGFMVPLQGGQTTFTEFLLVPYFGACIHEPAPPANQTVRVVLDRPMSAAERGDSAVVVTGTLSIERSQSFYGATTYRLEGASVRPQVTAAAMPGVDGTSPSARPHAHAH
jgi:hypothetical protein